MTGSPRKERGGYLSSIFYLLSASARSHEPAIKKGEQLVLGSFRRSWKILIDESEAPATLSGISFSLKDTSNEISMKLTQR